MSDFSLYVFHPYGAGKQKTAVSGLTPGSGGLGILSMFASFSNLSHLFMFLKMMLSLINGYKMRSETLFFFLIISILSLH